MTDQLTLDGVPDYTTGLGQKDALERHFSPDPLARFCVDLLDWSGERRVLEPSAGGGAFLRALDEIGFAPDAIDIDPSCWAVQRRQATCDNFLAWTPPGGRYDRIIGNPPFSAAEITIKHALTMADEVAFLLPMSRLETPERCRFYREAPLRHIWILAERVWPGSRTIGFFWFDASFTGRFTADLVSWKGSRGLEPR